MSWVPSSAWLTKIGIDAAPRRSSAFDLAIDASGGGRPVAGHGRPRPAGSDRRPGGTLDVVRAIVGLTFIVGGVGGILLLIRRRPPMTAA